MNKTHYSSAEMIKNLKRSCNEDNKTLQHVLEHTGATGGLSQLLEANWD